VKWVLVAFVLLAAVPLLTGCYQCLLATLHGLRRPVGPLEEDSLPHIAVVVPAWNEGAVIGRTIDTLVGLDYPADRLRVYVVDDASTDDTPAVVRERAQEHPGRVFHLRREQGGEGKSHTINHGLRVIRGEGWYEAVLVIDADVIFTERSLRRMARHLADERVGAVSGYIKEGSRPANSLNRFITYEYVNAQAGARRAHNVLGAQLCLPGGAELIRREGLEAIGGEIDTATLAEDTVTTLSLQLEGWRVVYEPHAIVWAEEPRDIDGLWKQRLRWARGNIQVTWRFRGIWLRRDRAGRLGSVSFALIWFSVFLMPILMLLSSASLVALFVWEREFSVDVFRSLWAINVFTYLYITFSSFSFDPAAARGSWLQGFAFPGLVSVAIILYALWPPLVDDYLADGLRNLGVTLEGTLRDVVLLFTYVWLSASMLAAWLLRRLERVRGIGRLAPALLYVVGYGPLLCAIAATAYIKQIQGTEMVWDKTEKTGAIGDVA
jgi:cellulose synthase/poly-beta-1,6-N-acetylglucosamine synthase-like glycosyltransferase